MPFTGSLNAVPLVRTERFELSRPLRTLPPEGSVSAVPPRAQYLSTRKAELSPAFPFTTHTVTPPRVPGASVFRVNGYLATTPSSTRKPHYRHDLILSHENQ
jgi:hypothetical protein